MPLPAAVVYGLIAAGAAVTATGCSDYSLSRRDPEFALIEADDDDSVPQDFTGPDVSFDMVSRDCFSLLGLDGNSLDVFTPEDFCPVPLNEGDLVATSGFQSCVDELLGFRDGFQNILTETYTDVELLEFFAGVNSITVGLICYEYDADSKEFARDAEYCSLFVFMGDHASELFEAYSESSPSPPTPSENYLDTYGLNYQMNTIIGEPFLHCGFSFNEVVYTSEPTAYASYRAYIGFHGNSGEKIEYVATYSDFTGWNSPFEAVNLGPENDPYTYSDDSFDLDSTATVIEFMSSQGVTSSLSFLSDEGFTPLKWRVLLFPPEE